MDVKVEFTPPLDGGLESITVHSVDDLVKLLHLMGLVGAEPRSTRVKGRTKDVRLHFTPEKYALIQAAAEKAGIVTTSWCIERLIEAARRS